MSTAPLLEVQSLRKVFGGLVAINDLSFSVTPGEVVALLGPNGSGKTTAMNLISGALSPDGGQVLFKGQRISGLKPYRIARLGIARTFQLVRVLGAMSCAENVEVGFAFRAGALRGHAARAEALALLERVGLADHAQTLAGELTYIDSKRLELARAMALQPDLLLLDEWLAGLNPTELRQGIALIREQADAGLTVVLIEHVMEAVHSLCARCIVMNVGSKIADGPTRDVLADPHVIKAYLGEEDEADVEDSAHA